MNNLLEKKILLIICGGISAYKSLEVIRSLKKKGAKVKTILTKSAKEFITPLSVASLSQEKVYDDLFNVENEAELMKNPVVATNVGGISEAIIDGVTGFLVEAGNHEQYIEKLKLLLDDKELRKQMGEAGRKFVEEKFNQDASVKGFLDAIRLYVKDK